MADKVLQDPTKQRLFEHSSMHELFEFPKKGKREDEKFDMILKKYASINSEDNQKRLKSNHSDSI